MLTKIRLSINKFEIITLCWNHLVLYEYGLKIGGECTFSRATAHNIWSANTITKYLSIFIQTFWMAAPHICDTDVFIRSDLLPSNFSRDEEPCTHALDLHLLWSTDNSSFLKKRNMNKYSLKMNKFILYNKVWRISNYILHNYSYSYNW